MGGTITLTKDVIFEVKINKFQWNSIMKKISSNIDIAGNSDGTDITILRCWDKIYALGFLSMMSCNRNLIIFMSS